ncbi:F0F1 ATP synthase subunit B [Anabaena sp. 4-3]|uniref:F0F1 ATP synthase subunit B family protein n=1 Tax=Anabaena sp. 4-3 TaxID=1811979 RepID=UPI000832A84D|nr:F0F1 ATP synthase subunit B [Anabaena sp. 4-3]
MLIDWFTVIAQIINFLILVFLLWRFLYKPITKTMQERQNRIAIRWQEAEVKQQEAEQEAESYRQQQREFNQQRSQMMADAKAEAEQEYKQLVQQARHDVEQIQAGWRDAIQREQEAFLENLRQRLQEQTYAITRRAWADLADANLEHQIIDVFIQRLQLLSNSQIQTLKTQSASEIIVRSSFEIPQNQRQKIINVLQEKQVTNNKDIFFRISPDLLCGVELQSENYQIAWSLDNYLQDFTEQLQMVLKNAQKSPTTTNSH